MRLFANAKFDFLGKRLPAYVVSTAVIVPGLLILLFMGLNYSVEFTGGTMVRIRTVESTEVGTIRQSLADHGIGSAEITEFGSDTEFIIRARVAAEGTDASDTQATESTFSGCTANRAAIKALLYRHPVVR